MEPDQPIIPDGPSRPRLLWLVLGSVSQCGGACTILSTTTRSSGALIACSMEPPPQPKSNCSGVTGWVEAGQGADLR